MEEKVEGERRRPPPPGPCPWLVYCHGKGERDQTFCTYVRSFRELCNMKTIRASCHGWLILCHKHQYSLLNPQSLESIQLPTLKLNPNQKIHSCTLSSPPRDPGCMVLLFGHGSPFIVFCRLGDEQWTQQWYENDRIFEKEYLICPVSCNGKVYAFAFYRRKLVEIDQNGDHLLTLTSFSGELPHHQPRSYYVKSNLVESCGKLFIIHMNLGGISLKEVIAVEIFKLDFSTMVWIKVESARDQAFFLDDNSAISCQAVDSEVEGGVIHFTREKSLYTFNVEDGSLLVSLPCQHLQTPWYLPYWVMPDLRLSHIREETTQNSFDEERTKEAIEGLGVGEGLVSDLPLDVLSLIVERLVLFDYMNFRAVCRMFQLVAPAVQWRTTLIGSRTHILSPWLMFREKNNGVCNFIDPKYSGKILMNIPDILLDATICYSKDDWSLYTISQKSMFFWNPFTGEIIQISNLPPIYTALSGFGLSGFGFSCMPMSSDCVVIGISDFRQRVQISFNFSWENEWYQMEFDNNLDFRPNHNSPVYLNEAFYFLGQHGNLGVFEMKGEEFCWEVLAKPQRPCKSFHQNFLLECDGELVSVFVGHLGKWVRVFRLNHGAMTWVEVDNLGNHSLYVSRSSSFSAVAKAPGMENKIYFPRLHGNGGIVYYSLHTRKYHTFENKDFAAEDFYDTREQLLSAWIEPNRWFNSS